MDIIITILHVQLTDIPNNDPHHQYKWQSELDSCQSQIELFEFSPCDMPAIKFINKTLINQILINYLTKISVSKSGLKNLLHVSIHLVLNVPEVIS